jgi:hypothetical protein
MTTIILIIVLGMLGSAVLVYLKEGADMVITFNKGFLVGIVTMKTYYELEEENDYTYQVALGMLIITLTWTKSNIDESK